MKPENRKRSRAITFEEFKKAKGASRVTTLPSSSSKAKKEKPIGKVKIQVGIKQYHQDGSLKVLKGRTLPLTVDADIDADCLLQEAIQKHSKHFQTFNCVVQHRLVYPDNMVVQNLRSSNDAFTLQKYKEELGKPYSKIYLYLCSVQCMQRADMNEFGISDDEMQEDVSHCPQVLDNTIEVEDPHVTEGGQNPLARDRKQSVQPSIVPFLSNNNQEVTNNQLPKDHSSKVACPVCYENFNAHEIARHADECAERFDPVGTVHIIESDDDGDCDAGIGNNVVLDEPQNPSVDPTTEEIKGLIESKLCPNVDKSHTNKVSVRRMYAFQDYVEARRKSKRPFKENGWLKVAFYGEPAVDDGGPRREFFTGTICYKVYHFSSQVLCSFHFGGHLHNMFAI